MHGKACVQAHSWRDGRELATPSLDSPSQGTTLDGTLGQLHMEDLEAQIEAARQLLHQRQARVTQAEREVREAVDRQRLRRELDSINKEIADTNEEIQENEEYTADIEDDRSGPHMAQNHLMALLPAPQDIPATNQLVRSHASCIDAVVSGDLEWTIQGMSWLRSTLAQNSDMPARSDTITIGNIPFRAVYAPHHAMKQVRRRARGDSTYTTSSLAVSSILNNGLTLRHSFFIKRNDGEFIQWGETCEERHAHEQCMFWNFGPDTTSSSSWAGTLTAAGPFNLSHDELLRSEWVQDDTMTVKIHLEVRLLKPLGRTLLQATTGPAIPPIKVPPPMLGADLLALLDGSFTAALDGHVTFMVGGEPIRAHAFVLGARSEVFAHMLSGSMREAASREVTIEECDALTFRALLRFLYSDDLAQMEEWVEQQAVQASAEDTAASATSHGATAASSAASSRAVCELERASLLQRVLAASHRYQVRRLQLWAEQQLAACVSVGTVCTSLCHAHLYEAKQLEAACLDFVGAKHAAVSVTPEFGALSAEWPAVMLKVVHKLAGVQEVEAAPAIEAATVQQGTKRKRREP